MFRLHASVAVMHQGQVLLVQEAKPESRGKWNLPGGHVDHGESLPAAAERELLEETTLAISLDGLIGIYRGRMSVRFVFLARTDFRAARPGDEIAAVKTFTPDQIIAMTDDDLVSPAMLRQIARDLKSGRYFPLDMFSTFEPG
jgi:ADP-ribose pyrophosphatase YjhB (NUDIX family)